jgi:hypothetical protein
MSRTLFLLYGPKLGPNPMLTSPPIPPQGREIPGSQHDLVSQSTPSSFVRYPALYQMTGCRGSIVAADLACKSSPWILLIRGGNPKHRPHQPIPIPPQQSSPSKQARYVYAFGVTLSTPVLPLGHFARSAEIVPLVVRVVSLIRLSSLTRHTPIRSKHMSVRLIRQQRCDADLRRETGAGPLSSQRRGKIG